MFIFSQRLHVVFRKLLLLCIPAAMLLAVVCVSPESGPAAHAAYEPTTAETAAQRMSSLKLIQGRGDGDLALNGNLTRAELVTVIVRAFGQESSAKLLTGAPSFPDTQSHWASGSIAMAKALVEKAGGEPIGMPDGTFNPDGKLTPAQAVAFLMKFLGVKPDTTQAWPSSYLEKAVELGIITAEDKNMIDPSANSAATRGLTFYLFDRAFYTYDLGAGKTIYTKYVDTEPPSLKVDPLAMTETTEKSVVISGVVNGASSVVVNGISITVSDGPFKAAVGLTIGDNTITVAALDKAGNKAASTLTIKRKPGAPAAIEAEGVTAAAGAIVKVAAAVTDAEGNAIEGEAIQGSSDVGTYADGTFKAGTKAGKGKLTLTSGKLTRTVDVTVTPAALHKLGAQKPSVKAGESTVITGFDVYGNIVPNVTFSINSSDASVDPASGVFVSQKSGKYTVTGKAGDAAATLEIGVSGAADRVVIDQPGSGWVTGQTYTLTARVVDSNGILVSDYNGGINWSASSGATVSNTTVSGGIVKASFLTYLSGSNTVSAAIAGSSKWDSVAFLVDTPPRPPVTSATAPVFLSVSGPETTVTVNTYGLPSPAVQPVSLQITAVSNRSITYSASGLPPGLTMNPSTGMIAGTIDTAAIDAGFNVWVDFGVTVTATNTAGQSAVLEFVWKVKMVEVIMDEPTPPVFGEGDFDQHTTMYLDENDVPIPGDPISLTIAAASNRPITYTAVGLPPGLTIQSETGKITGTISFADAHAGETVECAVTITATNSAGQSAEIEFTWFTTVMYAGE
ncbi:putative Ig domain-containing protein [Paenibacillus thermotolerans]|uniref:putative Ig domain-containing protein n=1 Tax=Paenibacillus thermotolerans TaxID=3027807 RepID=UPI0023684E2E|nr:MULTISPECIES: putative Ig domain-containing protein [unclassified Paenibacillus]